MADSEPFEYEGPSLLQEAVLWFDGHARSFGDMMMGADGGDIQGDSIEKIVVLLDRYSSYAVQQAYEALMTELLPVVYIAMVVSLMIWGISVIMRWVPSPSGDIVKKIFWWIVVLAIVRNWAYFDVLIYQVFTHGPVQLASMFSSSLSDGETRNLYQLFDKTLNDANTIANNVVQKSEGWAQKFILGWLIKMSALGMVIYSFGLILRAKVAIIIFLAVAPLFILALMFDSTKNMFQAWLKQMINFSFVLILTTVIMTIFLHLIDASYPDPDLSFREIGLSDFFQLLIVMGVCVMCLMEVRTYATALSGGLMMGASALGGAAMNKAAGAPGAAIGAIKGLPLTRGGAASKVTGS